MSEIEDATKPYLGPMIRGETSELSAKGQYQLATWLTLRSIVAEHGDPATAYIPISTREWFYKHKRPPTDWLMFAGHYDGEAWNGTYYRHAHFWVSRMTPSPPLGLAYPKTEYYQSSTFVAGNVFLQAISGTDNYHRAFRFPDRLAPLTHSFNPALLMPIKWPMALSITDREIDDVTESFFDWLRMSCIASP